MFCNNCGNQVQAFNKFCPRCGVPVAPETPPSPTPPSPSQPTPSSFQPASAFGDAPRPPLAGSLMGQVQKKSGCGKVLLILGMILVLGGGGIAAVVYFYVLPKVQRAIKSSEAYSVAVAALKSNVEVRARMGDIRETGFPIGSFSENADGTGAAAYRMSVEGAKASGNYNVVMTRRNSKWHLITGEVTLGNGETINIASPQDSIFGDNNNSAGPGINDNMPVPPPPLKPGQSPPGNPISGGMLNGKAIDLPKPAYPAAAKAAHASGTVIVQVLIDESGRVFSAHAVSGHPLLHASAEAAAMQARFSPTMLSGRPVKVSGIVTYNFEAQ